MLKIVVYIIWISDTSSEWLNSFPRITLGVDSAIVMTTWLDQSFIEAVEFDAKWRNVIEFDVIVDLNYGIHPHLNDHDKKINRKQFFKNNLYLNVLY